MNIVGILGKAGSGKDTAADMLVQSGFEKLAFADPLKRFCMELFDFSEEQLWGPSEKRSEPDPRYRKAPAPSYSSPLSFADVSMIELQQLEDQRAFGAGPYYLTAREALQKIGTEGARAAYDPVWVEYTIRKSKLLLSDRRVSYDKVKGFTRDSFIRSFFKPKTSGVVISDCRFKNEAQGIKKAGGKIIKIVRDGAGLQNAFAQHQSETEQDSIPDEFYDHIIYNNSSLDDLKKEINSILI